MLSTEQIEVIKEQAYGGYASELPGVCMVWPGMMDEMLKMGSNEYSNRLNLLLLTKDGVEKILEEKRQKGVNISEDTDMTPLTYLLQSANKNEKFLLELITAFSTFIKEDILLLPKINAVLVGSKVERRLITDENFEDFQMILRIQNRREVPKPPPPNESPGARRMRLKAEERDRIKRKQQQKKGETRELADLLEIAEVFGVDYKNKSIYAFYGLIQRHQLREKWTQDIQMLCAGADSKKIKAKYWGDKPD